MSHVSAQVTIMKKSQRQSFKVGFVAFMYNLAHVWIGCRQINIQAIFSSLMHKVIKINIKTKKIPWKRQFYFFKGVMCNIIYDWVSFPGRQIPTLWDSHLIEYWHFGLVVGRKTCSFWQFCTDSTSYKLISTFMPTACNCKFYSCITFRHVCRPSYSLSDSPRSYENSLHLQ